MKGDEPFTYSKSYVGHTLLDFWRWMGSDLNNNILRAALGEYIVAAAFGVAYGASRDRWAPYDVLSLSGLKIEVKTAAYIQTWKQTKPSIISFDIAEKIGENETGHAYRHSDLYVLCVYLPHDDLLTPLELENWDFYVVWTSDFNSIIRKQKTITLDSLKKRIPYQQYTYDGLCEFSQRVTNVGAQSNAIGDAL